MLKVDLTTVATEPRNDSFCQKKSLTAKQAILRQPCGNYCQQNQSLSTFQFYILTALTFSGSRHVSDGH
jgi:hypothetical protein